MVESRNVSVMKRFVIIMIILMLLITISAKSAEDRYLIPATIADERRKLSPLLEALNQAAAATDAPDRQARRTRPASSFSIKLVILVF
ncbi:hypothetical protein TIFTF001_012795 [Ficus carica]|uniref:Uncharacterized protein n=1 Tax=Ficus carica TaxID=3494 RepID=A0AA88D411_FICCA|nr:hypothetical protein TIFTF001_012795 [Ficus carica]